MSAPMDGVDVKVYEEGASRAAEAYRSAYREAADAALGLAVANDLDPELASAYREAYLSASARVAEAARTADAFYRARRSTSVNENGED